MAKENVPDWFDAIPNLKYSSTPGWVFVNAWDDFRKLRDAMGVVGPCEKGVKEMRDRAITMMLAIKA